MPHQRAMDCTGPGHATNGYGGTRGDSPLSHSTVASLRRVLHAFRDGWMLESRLQATARMIADDAHRHHLPAERMLVALKHEWRGVSAVCDQGSHHAALELQARLVSLCIRDYFATAGMARPAVVADRPQPR